MSTLYLQVTSTPYFLWSTSRYFQEKKKKLKNKKYNKKPRITLVDQAHTIKINSFSRPHNLNIQKD